VDNNKQKIVVNWHEVFSKIKANKKLFIKVWVITFVLSCIWILPQPRYYTSEVSVAPEAADTKTAGDLASLASSFGVNIGNASSDAIYPQLYPDLLSSTEFLVGVLDIRVKTLKGDVDTDYYTYLTQFQKPNYLLLPFTLFKNWLKEQFGKPEKDVPGEGGKRFNPFMLSRSTTEILKKVSNSITCNYSRTTDVVTIKVTDQDPLVSALLADSIKEHLQTFITEYRTKKSKADSEYYEKLTADARAEYNNAREAYSKFADAYLNITRESYRSELDALENEMQLKFNVYSTVSTRLDAARAKVQENTPAFTTLTNATVPVKPAGPKRMIFVAVMLFLSTLGTIARLYHRELKEWF